MASATSRIRLEIEARLRGFHDAVLGAIVNLRLMQAAVRDNQKAFDAIGTGIKRFFIALGAVGAIGNAAGLIAGLTATVVNLLPVALALPGILTGAAVAMATFKLATSGVSDALGGDAAAMAKLAPSARAFVQEINALRPAFDALRKSVQQEFFQNFAGDVKNIGAIYLPVLQRSLPLIAREFNNMGRSVTRALVEAPAQSDIADILDNTITGLGNMRQSLGHVVSGFIGLAAVGTSYLPRIGTAIDGVAFKFKHWIDQGIETGSLQKMIDDAIAGFKLLGQVASNIGDIVGAVFRGLSTGPQQDFLTALRDSTAALAEFLNQGDTQAQLGAIGQAFADVAQVTREVFLEALRQVLPIVAELAPVFAEVARVVGDLLVNVLKIVGPVLLQVAGFLNDNKAAIADLAPLVLGLWVAFKGASVLASVTPALTRLGTALGGPVAILKGGGLIALGALAIKINDINKETAKIENRPLTDMEDSLDNLVGAGRQIVTLDFAGIFSDIGDEWNTVVTKFQTGESPIGGFFQRLGTALETTRQSFVTIGTFIADFVTKTGQSFGEIGDAISTGFTTAVDAVKNFFTNTLPTAVGDFLGLIGQKISDGASGLAATFTGVFETVRAAIVGKLTEISTATSDFLTKSPYEIGNAIGSAIGEMLKAIGDFGVQLYTTVTGFMTDFSTQIQTGITNAVTYFAELPGRIGTAIADLTNTLATKAQEAGQAFLDWIGSFFTDATDRAAQVPDQVGGAVAGTATTLRDRAIEAGTQFVIWITNKFTEAVAFVQTAPGKIGAAIASLAGILRDKAIEAGTSFVNGVTQKFNEAVEFCRGIPGRISSAVGNLGGLLVNAGKQVIDGLLAGIKSGYNAMIDFVSGIADGIAAHKGPLPYDRKVLRPAGLALMGGLLGGMRDGQDEVLAFADTIASAVAATMAAATGAGPLATPAAAQAAQTNAALGNVLAELRRDQAAPQVRVFIGERELGDIVQTEIRKDDQDTADRVRAGGGTSF